MRLSGQCQAHFFKPTKTQINPKPTNKTKLSQQRTTKATIFVQNNF